MQPWKTCRNILCIRADNMGDVIMSGPALRALKKFTHAKVTLLTSRQGSFITPYVEEVDATLVYDLPWVKTDAAESPSDSFQLIEILRSHHFDAVVIFTVYSQSALPAALIAFLAGIPRRLAYSRENPYQLLTDWVPDQEPYSKIIHQVKRDLTLVESIGATADTDDLRLLIGEGARTSIMRKIFCAGVQSRSWIVIHPGVSELKREYPKNLWAQVARQLSDHFNLPVLITGSVGEKVLAEEIKQQAGSNVFSFAGHFNIEEFIALIQQAILVVSVNTSTVHMAAAMKTPLVVLYAQTNPQHTPWKTCSKVLYFPVQDELRSKNEIVNFVSEHCFKKVSDFPIPSDVVSAALELLSKNRTTVMEAADQPA
jgi:lipopolysaccharide heptosyltransferase II